MRDKYFRVCLVVSEVFSVWYVSSAILLYHTDLETSLTGAANSVFAFYTHFLMDVHQFSVIQLIYLPIAVGMFAVVAAVCMRGIRKGYRLAFVLPPIAACLLGVVSIFTFPAEPDLEACVFTSLNGIVCYTVWIICGAVLLIRE